MQDDEVSRGSNIESERSTASKQPVESEITLEGLSSFGHYHIFAFTWWSDFYTGGLEYDRHSWGRTLGAQMDYVGEVLPVVILVQPAKTDLFGDPLATAKRVVPGIGITPIGLRMMWRSDKSLKPYFIMKGGMLGFTHKALSTMPLIRTSACRLAWACKSS